MHFYSKNAFSKRKLFLNTLELYLLERHVFWQKLCNFELGLETKNEFEKWPLYNFVSVYIRNRYCLNIFTFLNDFIFGEQLSLTVQLLLSLMNTYRCKANRFCPSCIIIFECLMTELQSSLYKSATFGSELSWLLYTGGCLIKVQSEQFSCRKYSYCHKKNHF